MKKICLIILILIPSIQTVCAQNMISINNPAHPESFYGPEQLIEEVLIPSTCTITVNSFSLQVFGRPSENKIKSYGYFKKPPGSDFPFNEGIVITNGWAYDAGNIATPATIDNNILLPGDTDLENALSITNTADANFIKFNFTPLGSRISFRFLMASEEYNGKDECEYFDSFAFLLREVGTSTYTNLAVLPDGTPINVKNINKSSAKDIAAIPIECDANVDFFEGYDLGDTNYGGRTVVLTAEATVVPNTAYEIKLVVADQGDSEYDTGIFLEAGSFNLGSNLGNNRTVVDGNPGCDGTPIILDANIGAANVNYRWFKDNVEVVGVNNSRISVNTNGTYRVEIDINGNCDTEDEIVVEFAEPPLIANPPQDLLLCEPDTNLTEIFNFTTNENLVLGSQPSTMFPISYHRTQSDAEANTNPLALPYSNLAQTETIWMRIADRTQTCYEVAAFNIEVQARAIANTPTDYELCDGDTDGNDTNGTEVFDLLTKINDVLGTQSLANFDVKFYYTQSEADSRVLGREITTPINNSVTPQTIYARIENRLNLECYDTTSFNLIVNPLPVIQSVVTLTQCDNNNDGLAPFNLNEANKIISTNSANEIFTYYQTQLQAEMGLVADQLTNPQTYENPLPVTGSTVYARIETVNGCYRTAKVDLEVGVSQIPQSFQGLQFYACDNKLVDNDNTNGITTFDFSSAEVTIKNLFPTQNVTVTFFNNENDALAEINAINPANHRNNTSPFTQDIIVRVDSNNVNGCLGLGHYITLNVDVLPQNNTITDYILCSNTNTATFNLNTKVVEVIGLETRPMHISFHTSKNNAINNIPIGNPEAYLSNNTTIHVRAQYDDNTNGILDARECVSTDMSFNLVVIPRALTFRPDPIQICNYQTQTEYDLTVRADQITGNNPAITLEYYETQTDIDTNNPIANPSAYVSNALNNTVLVFATNTNGCESVIDLELNTIIYDSINLNPTPLEECEVDNNGFDFFDLRQSEQDILNGLNAQDFTFTYYENRTDAEAGNRSYIIDPLNFENTTRNGQVLYVRVSPVANACYQVVPLQIILNQVPEIQIEDEYVICLSADETVLPYENNVFLEEVPIDTQLNMFDYSFQWYNGSNTISENAITGETNNIFFPNKAGNYTVIATNLISGCAISATTTVVGSYPPERITAEVTTEAFSKNNIIEVTVVGNGQYEYSLDNGSWQDANSFENVRGGEHVVTVRDLYNCNELNEDVIIIDYPKFFTPNNDGINDDWQIYGIDDQHDAKIYIFDKYGKLLKQLTATSNGWDGTYNGNILPTNDYWFTVEYNDFNKGNVRKVFKSYFTLKR